MSSTIDRKVVEMQFDNAQFEKNVKSSMTTLEKLKSSLKFEGLSKGFESLDKESSKINFSGMGSAILTVTSQFSAFEQMAIGAMRRMGEWAIDTGAKFLKSLSVDNIAAGWNKFGDKTQSVGTLIAQGYDIGTVEDQLERLNWFTDETSYSFTDMVSNIAKFTAAGKELPDSVDALMGIATWAALSGQNASTASRAMYQLSQAMGAGVMRKEDYKSIQNVSMDTVEFRQNALDAAVALGTLKKNADGTYTSIVKGAKSSTFTVSQFADHLTQEAWFTSDVMMSVYGKYSGMADGTIEKIRTFADENNVTASKAIELLREQGAELDDFAVKAFKAAQEARTWKDVTDSVQEAVQTGFSKTFEIIFGNYEEATKLWTNMSEILYDVFATPLNSFNDELMEALRGTDIAFDQILGGLTDDQSALVGKVTEIAQQYGWASEETKQYIDSLKGEDNALVRITSHFQRLHQEAGETTKIVGASTDEIVSHTASLLGVSEEEVRAVKAIGDEFGYTSREFQNKLYNLSKQSNRSTFGMYELAHGMLAAGEGSEILTQSGLDSYLSKTYSLTDSQIAELHELADAYGANSDEVNKYLKTLTNMTNYGHGNRGWSHEAIQELLGITQGVNEMTNAWEQGDVVGYISNLTGMQREYVEELWDLVNAEERNEEQIRELSSSLAEGDENMQALILGLMEMEKQTNSLTGIQNVFASIANIWEYLTSLAEPVKQAFSEVFPKSLVNEIYNFTTRLKAFTDNLKLSGANADRLRRIFKGVFSIFKMVGDVVSAATIPFKVLFGEITDNKDSILETVAGWADMATNLAESGAVAEKATAFFTKVGEAAKIVIKYIKEFLNFSSIVTTYKDNGGGMAGVFSVIGDAVSKVISLVLELISHFTGWDVTSVKEKVLGFLDGIKTKISALLPDQEKMESGFKAISDFVGGIFDKLGFGSKDTKPIEDTTTLIDKLSTAAKNTADNIGNLGERFSGFFEQFSGFFGVVTGAWESVKNSGIVTGIPSFLTQLKTGLGKIKIDDVVALAEAGAGIFIGWNVSQFVKSIKKIPDAISSFATSFSKNGIFGNASSAIAIKNFAESIALLAASMFLLAKTPADRIEQALGMITGLILEMVVVMELMARLPKGGALKGSGLMKFAVVVIAFAWAIKDLAKVPITELETAASVMNSLIGVLAISEVLMSIFGRNTGGKSMVAGSASAILLAVAAGIVAEVIADITNKASASDIQTAGNVMVAVISTLAIAEALMSVVTKFGSASGMIVGSIGAVVLAGAIWIIAQAIEPLADKDPAKLEAAGKVIEKITIVLGLLAIVVALISKINTSGVTKMNAKAKKVTNSISLISADFNASFTAKVMGLGASFLALAGAIWIIVDAIERIAKLNASAQNDMLTAVSIIAGFAILIPLMVGILSKCIDDWKIAVAASGALIAFAASIGLLGVLIALIVNMLGGKTTEFKEIAATVGVLGVVMGVVLTFMSRLAGGTSELLGAALAIDLMSVGLIALAAALAILVHIQNMAGGADGLWSVVEILTVMLVALAVISSFAGGSMTKGAVSFVGLAVGIAALAAALALLSIAIANISITLSENSEKILSGVKTMADAFGSFLVGMFVSIVDKLKQVLPTIKDGILSVTGTIVSTTCEGLLNSSGTVIETALTFIGLVLDALLKDDAAGTIVGKLIDLLISVLQSIAARADELVSSVLDIITGVINGIADGIGPLISSVFNLFVSLINGVVEAMQEYDIADIEELAKALLKLADIMIVLVLLGALAGLAFGSVISIALLIVEIMVVMALIGKLAKKPGLKKDIDAAGVIFEALGSAVGKIASGFLLSASENLATIGTRLSEFITNAQTFITGSGDITTDSISGVESLIGVAKLAANSNVSVAKMTTFSSALSTFGNGLSSFSSVNANSLSSIKDIPVADITGLITAFNSVNEAPDSGKVNKFLGAIDDLFRGLKTFIEQVNGESVDWSSENLANAIDIASQLASFKFDSEGIGDMSAFAISVSSFGEGIAGFYNSISEVTFDMEKVAGAIVVGKALGSLQSVLPQVDGAITWFAGSTNNIGRFGYSAQSFGEGITNFANAISKAEFNNTKTAAAITVAYYLGQLQNTVPQIKGFVNWIIGSTNDLGRFGNTMEGFGSGIASFSESLKNTTFDIGKVASAITVAWYLGQLQSTMPSITGVLASLISTNDMGTFGDKLGAFGTGLASFMDAIKDVSFDTKQVTAAGDLAKSLGEMQGSLQATGGLKSIWEGNALDNFSSGLKKLAKGLVDFCTEAVNINSEGASKARRVLPEISELGQSVPESVDFTTFITNLSNLSSGLKSFVDVMSTIDSESVTTAGIAINALIGSIKSLMAIDSEGMQAAIATLNTSAGEIVPTLKNRVEQDLPEWISQGGEMFDSWVTAAYNGADESVPLLKEGITTLYSGMYSQMETEQAQLKEQANKNTQELANNITDGVKNRKADITATEHDVLVGSADDVKGDSEIHDKYAEVGETNVEAVTEGIETKEKDFWSMLKDFGIGGAEEGLMNPEVLASWDGSSEGLMDILNSGALDNIPGFQDATAKLGEAGSEVLDSDDITSGYYSSGVNCAKGFIRGMDAMIGQAKAKARQLGTASRDALNSSLDIHSPSKVTEESGWFFGLGFVNSVEKFTDSAAEAASNVGKSAVNGLEKALSDMETLPLQDVDNTLTIRPIFDLTEIQNGTRSLNNMLNGINGYAVDGSFGYAKATQRSLDRNGDSTVNGDPVFDKLTKAVEKLAGNVTRPNQTNNFNVTGGNSDEIVDELMYRIQREYKREEDEWA